MAAEASLKGNYSESVKHLNRALELDPNFIRANQMQGMNYSFLGQSELAIKFATKAFELRDRGTEYERLSISAGYYWQITGELDKATETFEYMTQTYPRSFAAHNNLAGLYGSTDQPEKSI